MVDFESKASPESLDLIHRSLDRAKSASGAAAAAPWSSPFYQYANRLAHLYYLAELNHVDAHLVFISFANAPDVPAPATVEQWEGAHRLVWKSLGLGSKSFGGRVGKLVMSVPAQRA
jgi:hypothetical protein